MICELIMSGLLNGPTWRTIQYSDNFQDNRSSIYNITEFEQWDPLARVMGGQQVTLRMTHKGLVRLSELEQALKTGRDRDPTGTVISKRHLDKDLTIASVSARADSPVAVCMLDMNGLKQINDTIGHAAGDAAIETYLKAIAVFLGDDAEGYRGDGDDELVIVMRGTAVEAAVKTMRDALTQLAKEKVEGVAFLSASCGVTATTDPNASAKDLRERVDQIQYRAKAVSKKSSPRPSVIAVNEEVVEVLPTPTTEGNPT
jgi:diguanylate cyclase (GGDEF)-like protein